MPVIPSVGAGAFPLTFEVLAAPAGAPRPRFAGGRTYPDERADEVMNATRAACVLALLQKLSVGAVAEHVPRDAAVGVVLRFRFARPKKHFTKAGLLRADAPIWHTTKPDADNLSKAILDAVGAWRGLFPLLWPDDDQVAALLATKVYVGAGEVPGVTFHAFVLS